jgi:hypothetical protein
VIPAVATGIRHVLVDTNHYKTFLHNRLAAPLATPGSIVLFQAESQRPRDVCTALWADLSDLSR